MKMMKTTMIIGAMVAVLLVCATGALADTVVIQDGLTVNDVTYWNTQDAKLHGGAPDTNYNENFNTSAEAYWRSDSDPDPWRGYPEHTLIKFEGLNFLSGRYASIDSVTLTLRVTVPEILAVDIYIQQVASSNDWTDSTATWNNNGASAWTGGAGLEGSGGTTGTISTLSIVSADPNRLQEYVFDLDTAAIVSWIEGGFDNAGMIIRPDVVPTLNPGTTTDPINFWAENHSTQTNRPILTINYTPSAAPPMPDSTFKVGWWDGFWNSSAPDRMGGMGANSAVAQNAGDSTTTVESWLDSALQNGLPTIVGIDVALVDAENTTAITAYVNALKGHAAVDGWLTFDSPAGDAPTLAKLDAAYDAIKAADPDRKVSIGFWAGTGTYDYLQSSYDHILAYSYPIMAGSSEFTTSEMNTFKSRMDNTSTAAASLSKTWTAVLQGYGLNGEDDTRRLPTFDEARFMLYYAIYKGATDATFYPLYRNVLTEAVAEDPYPYDGEQWQIDVFEELAAELPVLGDAIFEGAIAGVTDNKTDIVTSLFQDPVTDKYYLVAINVESGNENARFTVNIEGMNYATLLFEGVEEIAISHGNGTFSDTFVGYGVHVYEIHAPEPATMTLLAVGGVALIRRKRK